MQTAADAVEFSHGHVLDLLLAIEQTWRSTMQRATGREPLLRTKPCCTSWTRSSDGRAVYELLAVRVQGSAVHGRHRRHATTCWAVASRPMDQGVHCNTGHSMALHGANPSPMKGGGGDAALETIQTKCPNPQSPSKVRGISGLRLQTPRMLQAKAKLYFSTWRPQGHCLTALGPMMILQFEARLLPCVSSKGNKAEMRCRLCLVSCCFCVSSTCLVVRRQAWTHLQRVVK